MRAVKRIEIVIDGLQLDRLLKRLDELGVSGYTVLPDAHGRGHRGSRLDDELTGALKNVYVITACPTQDLDRVVDAVRPLLERFGGMCLISDAQWVMH